LEQAIGLEPEMVIVLGCVEGDLPRRPAPSPMLTTGDRDAVGLAGASTADAERRDRRLLRLVVRSARAAVATRPVADGPSGRERVASRYLEGAPAAVDEPSLVAQLRRAPLQLIAPDELDAAAVLRRGAAAEAVVPPALARGLAAIAERARASLGAYDGE